MTLLKFNDKYDHIDVKNIESNETVLVTCKFSKKNLTVLDANMPGLRNYLQSFDRGRGQYLKNYRKN
jgi:hypothetical protein